MNARLEVMPTELREVVIIQPARFGDSRGYFSETWNRRVFSSAGINIDFVQDNQSYSAEPGTVRGLHYQSPPYAQDKLVSCRSGRLIDVAVDVRRGSDTYGKWVAVELSAENGRQLFVPKGFLHGFLTIEPETEVFYKCSNYYAPEADGSVLWSSPSLQIDWQWNGPVIISEKDAKAVEFAEFESPFEMADAA
jgi:dTDP-4-dehydrorhamnose 3,5-epimerase